MRLIDADNLEETLDELERYVDERYSLWIPHKGVYNALNNAPTIARTERPFVMIGGKVIYITQGHIDALLKYEKKELTKEVVDRFNQSLKETTLSDYLKEQMLKDPEFRKEWEKLCDEETQKSDDVFTRKEELSKEESEWLINFITKEGSAE